MIEKLPRHAKGYDLGSTTTQQSLFLFFFFMKKIFVIMLLLSSSAFADTVYHFTIRKDNLVCAVDVHVRDNGKIKTSTSCFSK